MNRQGQVRGPALRCRTPSLFGFCSVADVSVLPLQFSPRGVVMDKVERYLPGIERPGVFFLVCTGAFGIAFSVLM